MTDIANAGDERLFVATRGGIVWLIKPNTAPTPFLDIADQLVPEDVRDWEQGYSVSRSIEICGQRLFYVTYTENGLHQSMDDLVVARFSISADPDVVDRESEFVILNVAKDHHQHNGGDLAFGPNDGYLYISVGNDEDPGNGKT